MKNLSVKSYVCFSAAWFLCACANGAADETTLTAPEGANAPDPTATLDTIETGPAQANQCGGPVDQNLANLAGATAEELGRWKAARDFQIAPDGASLELSAEGRARCSNGCPILTAVLDLQRAEAAMPDNDPGEFAAALVSNWKRQDAQPSAEPSAADHHLTRIGSQPSSCGGITHWFEAERTNCSGECGVMNPEALRHELLFAGYPDNGFLEFQSAFDFRGQPKSVVGIDPTWCPCEDGGGSATPTCYAQCTKISLTDLTGVCCSCAGATHTYVRAGYSATTYLCL